ncbi:MAG TPA: extracellular solute-binding protein [Anaerolineae bacterium]
MVELELSIMARGMDPVGDIQPLLDQFEAEHHIHVKVVVLTWESAWVELVKMALHGHGSDVSEIGTTWIGNLIAMNALRPFAASELTALGGPATFLPASWKSGTVIGEREQYAVPWLADTRLIYYQRDLLDKVGVNAATAFLSPEQLALTLSRLRDSGVKAPWVVPTRHAWNTLHNIASWIWGTGGEFVSADGRRVVFDRPEARAGIKAYFDLYRYLAPEARHFDRLQSDSYFWEKQAAVTITGSWDILLKRSINADSVATWGLALPPGAPFVGGSNLVIWQHARSEREAFRLVKFLMSKQTQATYNLRTGLLPVRFDTLASPDYTDDPIQAMMVTALHAGRSYPTIRLWGLIEDKLAHAFAQLWAEILDLPAPDIDALLDKYLPPLAEQLNSTLAVR